MSRDDILHMAQEAGGSIDDPSDLLTLSNLERFAALVEAAEREACAKVCESDAVLTYDPVATADKCAAAIRARSNP